MAPDVREHAHHPDYRSDRVKFVNGFRNIFTGDDVNARCVPHQE